MAKRKTTTKPKLNGRRSGRLEIAQYPMGWKWALFDARGKFLVDGHKNHATYKEAERDFYRVSNAAYAPSIKMVER